jgi:hypothetical protein
MRTIGIAVALAAICLAGCNMVWVKPGGTQQGFAGDRYTCLQQSQQQQSSAYINPYGGVAGSGSVTNNGLFNACMNAHGWYLQRQQ